MRIAISGAGGTVGLHVAHAAEAAGHEVVALSRASGVDLTDPPDSKLLEALEAVDSIVDATNA